jgi:hypothetical protein
MKRIFYTILIILFITSNLFAFEKKNVSKSDSCILIIGPNFHGTLFQENYIFDLSPDKSKRLTVKTQYYLKPLIKDSIIPWTPKVSEIYEFEWNFVKILNEYTTDDEYVNYHLPEIREKIEKYRRQYIGFKDSNNHKHLWIQFFLDDIKITKPDEDIIIILGGGSTLLLLIVDLEENKIEQFWVNEPI